MSMQQKYKDDFALLLEAGFIASNQADEDAAVKLFKASQVLNPDNQLPKIGFGYVHLLKLELKQATDRFEDVLKKEPMNYMAQALLGLSFALTTKEVAKGEKLLHEALTKTDDASVKNMASTALEFVEKYVKKSQGPAQLQSPSDPKKGKPKKGK